MVLFRFKIAYINILKFPIYLSNMDRKSIEKIQLLHPILREAATNILHECERSINTPNTFVRITHSLRTFDEQAAIYAQGRTTPGKRVTNAKAGQSIHNYGLALDMCFIINGVEASWDTKKDWDRDGQSDWMEMVAIFKKYGFDWGGNWATFKDMPHFDKTFGHTWRDLLAKWNRGETFIDANGLKYVKL